MTGLRRIVTVAAHDLELLRREYSFLIILLAMPLLIILLGKAAYAAVLHGEGYAKANGSEQVVPGMALTFVFFMVTFASLSFFREHVWNTWDRLRTLPIRGYEIILGKMIPTFAIICVQQFLIFAFGFSFFGLDAHSSLIGLVCVDVAFSVWLTSFILATVTFCHSLQQVLVIANLGAILSAGVGGALAPVRDLPAWVSPLSHLAPTFWAMQGFNDVLLEGKGCGSIVLPVAILFAFTLVAVCYTSWAFNVHARKTGVLREQ